tara:strand:+ start:1434 stop:2144 length:711 start_codon:yes stop_codon:yes gene_type:complete
MRALISIICLILGCALLVNLGLWQLKRGNEKEEITSLYDQRKKAVPTRLLEQGHLGPSESTIWTNYQLSGRFLNKIYLLDNRLKNSSAGYDVLSPFKIFDGPAVLVCLGWIAQGVNRDKLPQIPTIDKKVKIAGVFTPPPFSGLDIMPSVLRYEEMEKNRFRIQRIDLQDIGSKLDVNMYPLVFYTENPLPGLIRNAPDPDLYQPHKHYAYALQWFSMALVLACIGCYNLVRRGHG